MMSLGVPETGYNPMRILFALVLLFVTSCSPDIFYEKEFYERISSIKIPETFRVIESVDNGEFVTATTFRCDREKLKEFAGIFDFKPWGDRNSLRMLASPYLTKQKPDLEYKNGYLYHTGTNGKNGWLYVIDMEKGILWAEIHYPDAAGT